MSANQSAHPSYRAGAPLPGSHPPRGLRHTVALAALAGLLCFGISAPVAQAVLTAAPRAGQQASTGTVDNVTRAPIRADPTGRRASTPQAGQQASTGTVYAVQQASTGTGYAGQEASTGTVYNVTQAPFSADPTGRRDSTLAIRAAIGVAETAGDHNTVYLPAGTYKLDLIDGRLTLTDLVASGPHAITIAGAGSASTRLVEYVGATNAAVCAAGSADRALCSPCRYTSVSTCYLKDIVSLRADRSVLENLTLDTATYDAGTAFEVSANNTRVLGVVVTHGSAQNAEPHFPILYNGNPGSTRNAPHYHTGNYIGGLTVRDAECDDGISFSFQQNATIDNLTYVGARLAMYVDSGVTVTNFNYTPGPQPCRTKQGFWITSPSDHITINNYVDHASGANGPGDGAGVVGTSQFGQQYRTDSVTIDGYRLDDSAGATLNIANTSNFLLEPGIDGCRLAGSNALRFGPDAGVTVTNLEVRRCSLSVALIAPRAAYAVAGLLFDSNTFLTPVAARATFEDGPQEAVNITVSGGGLSGWCPSVGGEEFNGSTSITLIAGPLGMPSGLAC